MRLFFRTIHSFLYIIYVFTTFFLAAGSGIFMSFFVKDGTEFRFGYSKRWFRFFVLPPSLNRIKISGLENIPKDRPVIFASNHGSYFDVPVLLAYLPGSFRFIVKRELTKIPFVGRYITLSGHMSIDRKDGMAAHRTLNDAKKLLDQGISIIVFPEGTRTRDGSLGKFKRGSLLIAFDTGVSIVPVGISGSHKVMPRGSVLLYPGKIRVNIGKPIGIPKESGAKKAHYDEKLAEIRNSISRLIEKH